MTTSAPASPYPRRLGQSDRLLMTLNANGAVNRFSCGDISLNLFPGSEMEGGPTNVYLRRLAPDGFSSATPLLGPKSPAKYSITEAGFNADGAWEGIGFSLQLVLSPTSLAWFWQVSLQNLTSATSVVDLIYTQDLALADYGFLRTNEYYTSHYLDHTPLLHPQVGTVLATRQNLEMRGRHPWVVIGSLRRGVAFCSDARQFYGLGLRHHTGPAALRGALPGRDQHEHALAAIQDNALTLPIGETVTCGFFGLFERDHPAASDGSDLARVTHTLTLPEARPPTPAAAAQSAPAPTLFSVASIFIAADLSAAELVAFSGATLRLTEQDATGTLSGFTPDHRHIVSKRKELQVLRPHGQILRTGSHDYPEEASLTTTVWMAGVFSSMLTQGHVAINRCLSATHSYLSLFRAQGQRVFVEMENDWQLLDVPSACEFSLDGCRWRYQQADTHLEVSTQMRRDTHDIIFTVSVLAGPARRFLISHHIAFTGDNGANAGAIAYRVSDTEVVLEPAGGTEIGTRFPGGGFRIRPEPGTVVERLGGDELLFCDGRTRAQPFFCIITAPSRQIGLNLRDDLIAQETRAATADPPSTYWRRLSRGLTLRLPHDASAAREIEAIDTILPWFASNAMVHYLAPRGLEQFTGGGWGTRDVCQGPLELLLSLGHFAEARHLLTQVFAAQNADGDWPQWFCFFPRDRHLRATDAHGDIIFWPLLALATYLEVTTDGALLDERLPYYTPTDSPRVEMDTLLGHVKRALGCIESRLIPGTALIAYGHGDWNDAMQPFDPAMRERLCSSWTVTLHYQTLRALARATTLISRAQESAALIDAAVVVRAAFQQILVVDEVIAGFAYFHPDGRIDYLVHPRDQVTGLTYSALPMIHALAQDMLTPAQAASHLKIIAAHLRGVDGVRLFDRPLRYHGGICTWFQRAESAAFFGREIGLMYTHAHLRYCEVLARHGSAEAFFFALCQVNPIDVCARIPGAKPRQANCYYSSSDAAFPDRYVAADHYAQALQGTVPLEGGWRIYSSGPGIAVGLIVRSLLGLRITQAGLDLDPVMSLALDGLEVEIDLFDRPFRVRYHVGAPGYGPVSVELNEQPLAFTRLPNPYRTGGARLTREALLSHPRTTGNNLVIQLGAVPWPA